MKKVIGHRGAAGTALENSESAIRHAVASGTEVLEVDVRLSRDKKLVVCHDANLETMANNSSKIRQHNWSELQKIVLRDGSQLLLLEDVLKIVGQKAQLIIELKDLGSEHSLVAALDAFPKAQVAIASFKRPVLLAVRKLRPKLPLYVLEHTKSLDAIQFAKREKLQGVGLNFWLLSPHSYHLARRAGLGIYAYTVNNRFLAWFIHLFYPQVIICSDHPERFNNTV